MFIFWDNSNIHISGLNAMAEKEPNQLRELFRTNFPNLFALVKKDRDIDAVYLSGSIPPPNNALWDYLRKMGIQLQLLSKTSEGTEQESVDMSLQTMMLRTAIDHIEQPSTIAVLTGDGAGKQLAESLRDKALMDNDYAASGYARDMEQEAIYAQARARLAREDGP